MTHEPDSASVSTVGASPAGHTAVAHTADAGFSAHAGSLKELFIQAALALAELTADVDPGAVPTARVGIELQAADLPGLAFAWLNELIAQGEITRGALVGATVRELTEPASVGGSGDGPGGWRLRGDAAFRGFDRGGVRVRRPPKSATFHRLSVEPGPGGWAMLAYLDI